MDFPHIKIVHCLPGRVRLRVSALKGNKLATKNFTDTLKKLNGIYSVRANPLTGRMLIYFNEQTISLAKIIETINCANTSPELTEATKNYCYQREPEDLPIKKQLFNVALGGGVLAYMGIKHLFIGRTPLAKHPQIFYLTAATAIISGYPLIKNGFQGIARGQLNHDAIISGLAIGTVLARESLPGLMVIWLANLTALGQSLILRAYQANGSSSYAKELPAVKWQLAGQAYSNQSLLPVAGISALSGLTGGKNGLQKTLAMLLAANPAPAGLAAPTAATATLVKASRNNIIFRDTHAVEKTSTVDTVIINVTEAFLQQNYEIKDVLPLPGISVNKLLSSALQSNNDHLYTKILSNNLHDRKKHLYLDNSPNNNEVLVGDKETLIAAGIDIEPGIFKAKRLQHLDQLPVYVAINKTLAGVIGLKQRDSKSFNRLIRQLKLAGIKQVYLLADNNTLLNNNSWSNLSSTGISQLLAKVKQNNNIIAVVNGNEQCKALVQQADINIIISDNDNNRQADVIVPHQALLPAVFRLATKGRLRVKQDLALVKAANTLGLALAASGRLSPMNANVFNNLISVAVGANSYRLLRQKDSITGIKMLPHLANQEIAAALASDMTIDLSHPNNSYNKQYCGTWHNLTTEDTLQKLQVNLQQGLSTQDVLKRLNSFGPNKLAEPKPKSFLARVLDQFKDFLVKALIGSATVCAFMGQFGDALAIVVILIMNALLGAMQEQKADGSLQALNKMTAPTATVRRNGKTERIPAAKLLPGDIVILEQGDSIPADLRLLETHLLEIEESALTGEPYPVPKKSSAISDCVPLLDCENLAFMGTNITKGRAVGIVIATGMNTEIGKIASMLNEQEQEPTPLQQRMAEVGNTILKYCLAVSGLVVLAGILRGGSLFQMILTGVSLAVAAIPEGLPAVVTIAMASGVRRMAKEHAVVRQLPAVETLGSATLICTDKTGTLTQNRQQVQSVFTAGGWWHTNTEQKQLQALDNSINRKDLENLLTAAVLCNDANVQQDKSKWQVDGDPTEGALLMAAINEDLNYQQLRNQWHRIKEIPFDSERLRMTVVCQNEDHGSMSFVKGAPEVIIEHCQKVQLNGQIVALTKEMKEHILTANKAMTEKAMRVLAIACRNIDNTEDATVEDALTFLGLVGMVDPPRAEVKAAIAKCHRAGIKVVMITGDHPHTALAIAKEVGITNNNQVLTGQQLANLTDYELAATVLDVNVFARVLPAHKLRLIKAFRQRGQILAMVGDGINDAPAVKESDIGVAMGESGTDVTKQASAIILTDDNFTTLVSAVEQGRGIYNNIKRSVRYLLSTNVGLVSLVFLSVIFGLPMPLLPIQLLFINVLGDGLPALALGVEKPTEELMTQPPRAREENFFADGLDTKIISKGLAIGVVGLATYYQALKHGTTEQAQTLAMATFTVSKLLSALECSDQRDGSYNQYLIGSVALSFALLLAAIYLPVGRRICKTSPLGLMNITSVFAAAGLTWLTEKVIAVLLNKNNNHTESCQF